MRTKLFCDKDKFPEILEKGNIQRKFLMTSPCRWSMYVLICSNTKAHLGVQSLRWAHVHGHTYQDLVRIGFISTAKVCTENDCFHSFWKQIELFTLSHTRNLHPSEKVVPLGCFYQRFPQIITGHSSYLSTWVSQPSRLEHFSCKIIRGLLCLSAWVTVPQVE